MIAAAAPLTALGAPPRQWIGRGIFAGFGPHHVALAVFVTTIVRLVSWAAFLDAEPRVEWLSKLWTQLGWIGVDSVAGIFTLLCAIAVDNLFRERLPGALRLAIALVPGSIGGAALEILAQPHLAMEFSARGATLLQALGVPPTQIHALRFSHALLLSFVLIVLYATLERSRRASARLHATRMAALGVQHELVEGELRAMQARVDPELLFGTLLEIDLAYGENVARGQERLDALIRYLRAALPTDENGRSTVAREQELAAAYVELTAPRGAGPVQLEVECEGALRDLPMPPMLLLPLVRWAIDGAAAHRLTIAARRLRSAIEFSVESRGAASAAPPGAQLEVVRERMARLFAEGQELTVEADGGFRRAILTLPPLATA
jgi:hypothetical protein